MTQIKYDTKNSALNKGRKGGYNYWEIDDLERGSIFQKSQIIAYTNIAGTVSGGETTLLGMSGVANFSDLTITISGVTGWDSMTEASIKIFQSPVGTEITKSQIGSTQTLSVGGCDTYYISNNIAVNYLMVVGIPDTGSGLFELWATSR